MSSIIMRIPEFASLKEHQFNPPLAPLAIAQVAVAAVVGSGVNSLEAAVRWGVPFFIDERPYRPRPFERKFPLNAVFDRAKQMLVRAHSRSKAAEDNEPLDEVELEVKATELGTLVVEAVKATGLHVYTQKLLFSPELRLKGSEILKGLVDPGTEIVLASVAIASGAIPPPPSVSTKEHLVFLGPKATYKIDNPTFAQWVAMGETFLVEYPLPNLEAGDMSRHDYYAPGRGPLSMVRDSASLGLGFFVMRHERLKPTSAKPNGSPYFHVLTPTLQYHGDEAVPWSRPMFETKTIYQYYGNSGYQQLDSKLRNKGRTFIAKLKVCPSCEEIYSDARADLKKSCTCVEY